MNPAGPTRPQTERVGVIYTADGPVNDNCWNWWWILLIVILVIIILVLLFYLIWCYMCPSVVQRKDECTPRCMKVSKGNVEYEYHLAKATVRTCDPELTYVTEYVSTQETQVPQAPSVMRSVVVSQAPVVVETPVRSLPTRTLIPTPIVSKTPVPTLQPQQAPIAGVETEIVEPGALPFVESQRGVLPTRPPSLVAPVIPATSFPARQATLVPSVVEASVPTYSPVSEINSPIDSLTAQYIP